MRTELKRWWLAWGYVAFIYATLGMVVTPLRFLRLHGVLRLTLVLLYISSLTMLLRALSREGARTLGRTALLLGVFAAYGLVTRIVTTPEEQLHFLEYGLVGALFARALSCRLQNRGAVFMAALTMAGMTGWLDEIIQGFIPNRHYDVHDIFLNVISAFLGLVIFALFPTKTEGGQGWEPSRARSSSTQS